MPDIRTQSAIRKSGVVVPHQARWHQRLLAALAYLLIRCVAGTVRFKLNDQSGFFNGAPKENLIFVFWHNRLALSAVLYRRYVLKFAPDRRIAGMVSASRDGGLLARILEHFHIQPVRGSSSRRGGQALLELTTWAERGWDLAITPDGPLGPRYVVQDGAMALAQMTGLPLVPVSYDLTWKIRVKSWDQFQIPLPFSRCHVSVGRILRVPREADDARREELRQQLEAGLRAITRD
ncbi:MAG: lysophospholipid acyltransferase family protein [Verrucomicrobiota bacterium]|nr:lysophospholipid acyltransferase family protein [Verrucomicrobiota bacterium]